ncbi:ATP-binding protein [Bradyrhizobium elkanii]|uniref:ATP-binding protein n=1 Tax=Bradyrhizobium elkanii TaxID=29448 RepID=UPI0005C210AD|nr:ATP-binding protein [Bradyrhizobium elkanii]KIU52656.1 histidine kinase [Bradyrhizobium elkanii]
MTTVSLRRATLVSMTVLLTLVGAAAMLLAYKLARDEAADFLDGQLRQVALNAGLGLPDADAPPASDQDPEDQIAVTIWKRGVVAHTTLRGVEIARPRKPGFENVVIAGEPWRVYSTDNDTWTVQVAQRDKVRQEFARSAAVGAAAPILIVIPLSWLVVGWALNRMLGRLDTLARDIANRSAVAVAAIPLTGIPIEVAPLVESMNGLIVRLRAAVEAQKRFLSDAAHELRTPLAAMQIQVDNLKINSSGSVGAEFEAGKAALAQGVRRASALVGQLLRLARLDEPVAPLSETVEVGPLLLDCVGDHVVLAEHKGIDLGARMETSATLHGSVEELRVLFANLIDNAVRYTPSGGQVDISLTLRDGRSVIEVLDTGTGLPPGVVSRIFDRFYRAAPPDVEGTGLGLAIARRIAERNGLVLTVENRPDGAAGVLARVTLPA